MRLDVGAASDRLVVGTTATLDGTLTLTGLHALSADTWTIITYASHSGNFSSFSWPDTGTWQDSPGATAYEVDKV
jgi:hypothetical protein